MIELCAQHGCRAPEFEEKGDYFKVSLFRPKSSPSSPTTDNRKAIIDCIRENPSMTQPEISDATGLSLPNVKKIMSGLGKSGEISRKGARKSGTWIVNGTSNDRASL